MLDRKNGSIAIVSVIIALSDLIFIILNYHSSLDTLNKDTADWAQQVEKLFKINLENKSTSMQQLATFIAHDPRVSALFKMGKDAVESEGGGPGKENSAKQRNKLLDLVNPSWQKMTQKYDVRQLHFHLGPGSTSFLRVHRPEKFGDNMDEVRYTVVDVNQTFKATKGFETGRVYSGIRGVVPISFGQTERVEKEHVGALEAGTSFSILLKSLRDNLNTNFAILLTKEHVQQNMWASFVKKHFQPDLRLENYFIEATTDKNIRSIVLDNRISEFLKLPGNIFIKGKSAMQVCTFPLRDYRGTKNAALADSGIVLVWKDASKQWASFKTNLMHNIIFAVLALLVIEIILYFTWQFSRRKLRDIIKTKTKEINRHYYHLKKMIETFPIGILVIDNELDKICEVNPKAIEMIGAPEKEIVGHSIKDYIKKNESGDAGKDEYLLTISDGSEFHILKVEAQAEVYGKNLSIISISDINQKKKQEYEIIQKEKFQSVLEMAGAVCHELNQPLMVISGYGELISDDAFNDKKAIKEYVSEIKVQIDRLGAITKKLMNITQYQTKKYLDGQIIDIDKASDQK
ncbi:cache domain-containing protein [uncultured Desulfobacter sp.]|uniref:cache domain-containing protein n=1 Tax=uncultured Desulfobacter sp. TaxID=240139 RepID=UPI0029C8108C|nr:cache domain-containing protein [uncultured Desulfobacter sp.]